MLIFYYDYESEFWIFKRFFLTWTFTDLGFILKTLKPQTLDF